MAELTVVLNTSNVEDVLPRALASVKDLADEIVVVDMKSSDKTVEIAEKVGARVYEFKKVSYVEPARNFAISKASKEWVLVLDPDEEISKSLAKKIKKIIKEDKADYVRIPRKNIVFGKWLQHSRWWPDYNIRLFKKDNVEWDDEIHSVPITQGKGIDLPAKDEFAIIHHNYQTLEQYIERMNRYTSVQADELVAKKHKFLWKDLIKRPLSEFLSRYFAGEGYKDGLHGLALAILQAFSEAMVYLKIWQKEKFLEQATSFDEVASVFGEAESEVNWWITEKYTKEKGAIKAFPKKVARRLKYGKKT